jgi:hypothetical protein
MSCEKYSKYHLGDQQVKTIPAILANAASEFLTFDNFVFFDNFDEKKHSHTKTQRTLTKQQIIFGLLIP